MKLRLLLTMMLAMACAAPKGQTRAEPGEDAEVPAPKMAPPEAVKLAAAKGLPDPNELICTYERETGTNIPDKICRTRWQIDEARRQANDWMTNHNKSCSGVCQ